MNDIRVVVADDNGITRDMIIDFLSGDDDISVVGSASDGELAVSVIKDTHPDIVLLDLVMPKLDGIGVMEKIAACEDYGGKKPEYIVISAAGSEEIIGEAIRTGASYFILKPFAADTLIRRVRQTAAHRVGADAETETAGRNDLDLQPGKEHKADSLVVALLRSLGVSMRMVGYKYIRDAVILAIKDPDALTAITKSIYPEIAKLHQSSSGNVERNIRYVIEVTWEKRNDPRYADIFRKVFDNAERKPANSKFIMACAEWINYSAV